MWCNMTPHHLQNRSNCRSESWPARIDARTNERHRDDELLLERVALQAKVLHDQQHRTRHYACARVMNIASALSPLAKFHTN